MLVGLVSDTHGVWDPALATHFSAVDLILHAGDVGSHGGTQAVLSHLQQLAPVTAVRGNVDDDEAALAVLPETSLLCLAGWTVLLLHILGSEGGDAAAESGQHQADIIVHGHSHIYSSHTVAVGEQQQRQQHDQGQQQYTQEERLKEKLQQPRRQLHINPGSAGPARFKLGRSVALLTLPDKGSGGWPSVERIELAAKAPPRLPEAGGGRARRQNSQKESARAKEVRGRASQGGGDQQSKRLKQSTAVL